MSKIEQHTPCLKSRRRTAKYKECLLTYYDILGFGDMVKSDKSAAEIHEMINKFYAAGLVGGGLRRALKCEIVGFSDTVVRSYADPKPFLKVVFLEIINIGMAQASLLKHGVVLRGCVTTGSLFAKNGVVFGPALVKAHDIAERVAIYPRVVIDPVVLRKMKTTPGPFLKPEDVSDSMSKLQEWLRKDADGTYYVDYLRMYAHYEHELKRIFPGSQAAIERHRDLILVNGKKYASLDSISSKYNWLAHYHNSTVNSLGDTLPKMLGCSRDDLLVPLDALKATCDLAED